MAKLPENRYQNISDLLEDLTIAGGMFLPRRVPSEQIRQVEPLVAPPKADDIDEITVVRQRPEPPPFQRAPVTVPIAPPRSQPTSGFNPVKILIPSALALLVVFAVIYAFTRNPTEANMNVNTNQPGLAADPNSQPVQAASPPTGSAEQGIPSGGNLNSANANANKNANALPSPSEEVNPSPQATTNENSNSNPAPSVPAPQRTASPINVPLPGPPPPSGTPVPRSSPAEPKPTPTIPTKV